MVAYHMNLLRKSSRLLACRSQVFMFSPMNEPDEPTELLRMTDTVQAKRYIFLRIYQQNQPNVRISYITWFLW